MESRNLQNPPQKRKTCSGRRGLPEEGSEDVIPVDRISNLPESIISHILSFLPTKSVVETSLLSKSWRFRWTEVTSFDFNDGEWLYGLKPWGCGKKPAIPFEEFVNRVLGQQKSAESSVDKFRLKWLGYQESGSTCFGKWVSTAVARNVRFLELNIQSGEELQVHLPGALYTCCSLEVLKLSGDDIVVDPDVVRLPKLAVLELIYVADESYESFPKLLSGCPVLQSLRIDWIYYSEGKVVTISSPTLKHLQINFHVYFPLECWKLKINTPKLEYLVLDDDDVCPDYISLAECEYNMSLAKLVRSEEEKRGTPVGELVDGDGNHELVQAFYGVKFLKLSVLTSIAVRDATKKLSASFESLTKLVIGIECCQWLYLMDVINCCVKLQVLYITRIGRCWLSPSRLEDPISSVPRCLSSSLSRLSYRGFGGLKDEMKMLEYILKHASVIEIVDLSSTRCTYDKPVGSRKRSQILKNISDFSRASRACKVSFF